MKITYGEATDTGEIVLTNGQRILIYEMGTGELAIRILAHPITLRFPMPNTIVVGLVGTDQTD